MDAFLKEILEDNSIKEIILSTYKTVDGYKITNCPYNIDSYGFTYIPAKVQFRIFEIIREMRDKGCKESTYYEVE